MRNATSEAFNSACDSISKLCKIIVKEDVVLVKDGGVIEFNSVKEYLDNFRGHLEFVRLKRLKKDSIDFNSDLLFLEAKLKFLNFMVVKKRNNKEIVDFVSNFPSWISSRLQKIEIVKLSSDHIKQTEQEIKDVKVKIKETEKKIKEQEKIYKQITTELNKKGKTTFVKNLSSLFETTHMNGIEIFQVEEQEEESLSEEIQEEDEI
jgi:hypothetical protein